MRKGSQEEVGSIFSSKNIFSHAHIKLKRCVICNKLHAGGVFPYYANRSKRILLTTWCGQSDWSRLQDHLATMFSRPHSGRLLVVSYLKSLSYHLSPSALLELKDSTCHKGFAIYSNTLQKVVTGVVSLLVVYDIVLELPLNKCFCKKK
ncbi:UNVERIFIED_CONTAM: hypothetical protein NCL1_28162 [Trichonephila clavipes]